ncbi:hypothetical protein METHP14_590015 [Pseudomonas sp. P14-2025]
MLWLMHQVIVNDELDKLLISYIHFLPEPASFLLVRARRGLHFRGVAWRGCEVLFLAKYFS